MLPTVERIRGHYRRLKLDQGWSVERMQRLCKMVSITEHELCALCNCNREMWWECMRYGKFNGPMTLHFALIESAYVAATTGHSPEPILPFHKTISEH